MEYTFEQLKQDVKQEADNIKIHATKEEISKLNISNFNPFMRSSCIYGLMTGDCFSGKAAELIEKCATRYIADAHIKYIEEEGFERIKNKVNGATVENLYAHRTELNLTYHYSAIEAYIFLPEANNQELIDYIKGESETLDL